MVQHPSLPASVCIIILIIIIIIIIIVRSHFGSSPVDRCGQRPPHRLLRCPPQRRPRAPRRQLSRRRSQWLAFLRPLAMGRSGPRHRCLDFGRGGVTNGGRGILSQGGRPGGKWTRQFKSPSGCGPQRLRAPCHSSRRPTLPAQRRPRAPPGHLGCRPGNGRPPTSYTQAPRTCVQTLLHNPQRPRNLFFWHGMARNIRGHRQPRLQHARTRN